MNEFQAQNKSAKTESKRISSIPKQKVISVNAKLGLTPCSTLTFTQKFKNEFRTEWKSVAASASRRVDENKPSVNVKTKVRKIETK